MRTTARPCSPRTIALVLATVASLGPRPLAGQGPTSPPAAPTPIVVQRLIVLDKAAAAASIFDPQTRRELARIDVGVGPHEVAVAPDGRTAVVCNYGDQRPGNTLTILDVPGTRAIATFALRGDDRVDGVATTRTWWRPHGICFLADGRRVVVTSEQQRRLLVVDLQDQRVLRALPTPQSQLHMVVVAADGRRAFGAGVRDGSLGIFDLDDATAPAMTIATGAGAEGLALRPGTGAAASEVWVANRAADTLSIVDPNAGKVLAELPTAALPIRVAFTPDGALALVSCADAGEVQVFDAATRRLTHTIVLLGDKTELSPLPIGLCIEPDGRRAWVACARGEFLAVVDLTTFRLVDRVPAGPGPDGMAWAQWHEADATK